MPAEDAGWQAAFARMTQVAVFHGPRDGPVVAHTAKTAFHDVVHLHLIGSGAHLEAELEMADLAAEANAMKPVRENNRAHSFLF